jgi:hypothetical protein
MSTAGMNNFKGLDYQTWSAVLLFLMRSREASFDSIILEDKNWEDFTLVYVDGKKIVCESKYYARAFTTSNLLKILKNITESPDDLSEKDEILIVCPSVSDDLEERIKHLRWYTDHEAWFTQKGYSAKEIELLPRVSFFKPESAEFLYEESLAYFYNHPKLAGAWLPRADVERWLDSIVMSSFFRKATKGEKFTRQQLSDDVDNYYDNELDKNVEYDRRQTDIPQQFKSILTYIKNHDENQIKRNISAWTIQPDLMYFVIQEIFSQKGLKLADWDIVWSKIIDRQYSFRVVYDFKDHIKDRENAAYTIGLFASHTDAFTNPAFDDFRAEFAMQTMELILKEHPDLSPQVYDFIEAFLKDKRVDYTELDDRSDRQEKVEIAKLLVLTFNYFQANENKEYISKTIELVSQYFNLIDDDGEYDIYTPSPIFNILYKYLTADFINRIEEVIDIIVSQYQNAKIYGGSYNGWDGMGGGVSQSGDQFTLNDRHYIKHVLEPALKEHYAFDKKSAWKLVNERFISKDSNVSVDRPDFLNRAALHIVLQEYSDGEHSDDALKILKNQVIARKGIPSKHELIFQMLRDKNPDLSNDKKWSLINIFLKKYTLPYSVFVEQIVSSLALDGDERALSAIVSWMDNPEYRKRQVWHSFYVGRIMIQLLSSDPTTKLFETGVEVLNSYLKTKEFTHELGSFDSYDISRTIAQVIERDYDSGLKILRDINKSDVLTSNQQTAIWLSIEQVDKGNKAFIGKLYQDFVRPVLYDELGGDNSRIEARLTEHYPRQLAVQFGEHLAKQGFVNEALEIARIFINDSHPKLENDPDDPKGQSNYHLKILNGEEDPRIITTVRGWVAWILSSLISMRGKDHLEEVAQMTEKLVKDENLYVVTQGMIPLTSLMQNRHSVLPKTDKRFIPRELSDHIENLSLELVDKYDNKVILHHLEAVLHRFRTMTTEQAMHVFKQYGLVDNMAKTDDIYTLLISFALFRKNFFTDESFKKLFGEDMYQKVNNFDDQPFKDLLNMIIESDNDEARTHIGWFFWTLPKKGSNYEEDINLSFEYLDKIADRYTREAFNRAAYFVNDRIKERPEQSLRLWEKITRNEQAWISENYKTLERSSWWSHHYNDDFLITAKELAGDEKYLEMLEIILSYPEGYQPMFKPQLHYDILRQIKIDEAKTVLDKLKASYPSLYAKDIDEN